MAILNSSRTSAAMSVLVGTNKAVPRPTCAVETIANKNVALNVLSANFVDLRQREVRTKATPSSVQGVLRRPRSAGRNRKHVLATYCPNQSEPSRATYDGTLVARTMPPSR